VLPDIRRGIARVCGEITPTSTLRARYLDGVDPDTTDTRTEQFQKSKKAGNMKND